jgi:glycosyltransferase involved in cell wall biosynthesis
VVTKLTFLSTKFNVLFLCGWYPSKVSPNNGDFIQRHAEAVSLNHKVTVIHIITDKETKKNIDYTSGKINGIETHIGYIKLTKNPIIKVVRFWKTYKLLLAKIDHIDLVHLNELFPFGIFALHLKWFQKKPFIISEHWTGYRHQLSEKISFVQKIISKIIAKNASFICPVTKDLQESMTLFGLNGTYKVVENVVDTAKFYPTKTNNKVFKIVHISNMNDNHKNIRGILNVVAKLVTEIHDFKIELIGENATNYKTYATKLNISDDKISFINQVSHKKISEHLKNADLFILFSNFENLPCVILESFASGIPVISTNVGGIKEYFPKNFGTLISAKNEEELLNNIKIFHQKEFKTPSKEEMHTYAKTNFSTEAIAEKFTNLYQKSLKL